jgi:hypothetical protein
MEVSEVFVLHTECIHVCECTAVICKLVEEEGMCCVCMCVYVCV